ncbi:MAG: GNAT family N-acetyltransferase [Chitinispirillaceae bacterium]
MIRISLHPSAADIEIRPIELDDSDICALADLINQEEKQSEEFSIEHIEERIIDVKTSRNAEILVAEKKDDSIIGYAHINQIISLKEEPFAELRSISVDKDHKDNGIEEKLLKAVEEWSRKKGFGKLVYSSQIKNDIEHTFFEKQNYKKNKQYHSFSKSLK